MLCVEERFIWICGDGASKNEWGLLGIDYSWPIREASYCGCESDCFVDH